MKDKLFYVGQKAIINKNGRVLILRDSVLKTMDLPGGKIQEGENNFNNALKREVFEETRFKIKINEISSVGFFKVPLKSNHRSAGKEIFMVFYICTYIEGVLKLSYEHDKYIWVTKKNYKTQFNKKSNIYNALKAYFENTSNYS